MMGTGQSSTNIAMRAGVEVAFRHLPLLEGTDHLLQAAVNTLCGVDNNGTGAVPPKFSDISRRRTKKELQRLADPENDPFTWLDSLHQPAILALAKFGFCRGEEISSEKLRAIAKKAAESDLSWVPEKVPGGRPQNRRAHAVATLLAYYYEMLTGKKPTRTVDPYKVHDAAGGQFFEFVREIFAILNLKVNIEDVVRAAIKQRKEHEKKRKSTHRVSSIINR